MSIELIARFSGRLRLFFRKYFGIRPLIELQSAPADCGYVALSAIFALQKSYRSVDEIKDAGGSTSRGLTIKQLRDVCRRNGLHADVISFAEGNFESLRFPCILLLKKNHFVVASQMVADQIEIYDPGLGWYWTLNSRLKRKATQFAVEFESNVSTECKTVKPLLFMPFALRSILNRRDGRWAFTIMALGQLFALSVPLVSMFAVNQSTNGQNISIYSAVAFMFVGLSLTGTVIALVGDVTAVALKRAVHIDASKLIFDQLSKKQSDWFSRYSAPTIKNFIDSLYIQIDFEIERLKAFGGIAIGLIFGVAILVMVSPWLALPGLIALSITAFIDVVINRTQRMKIANSLDASQHKQRFVLDVLSRMPELIRHGASRRARNRFVSVVRARTVAEAQLSSLQSWRSALLSVVRSGENLIFVAISAIFWAKGQYSLGAFVALGAYKDLIAQNLNALLQLHLRGRSIDVHRLQTRPLLSQEIGSLCTNHQTSEGYLTAIGTSFQYGSLDPIVFRNCSLSVGEGEFVAIKGPSGIGKSTFAKLLVGLTIPTEGQVQFNGQPIDIANDQVSAVLQTDRLIDDDILNNILYYRNGYRDTDAIRVLKTVELYDFVFQLPMKWKTKVSDTGPGLSGGQKQRLLLARAILNDPKLLILDEATSSLEVDIEQRILTKMRLSGTTIVAFAHRPEVWALADRTLTFTPEGLKPFTNLSSTRAA